MINWIWISLLLVTSLSWGQSRSDAPLFYVAHDGSYVHPKPVIFAQAFNRFLVIKIENNQLTITNPRSVSFSNVQIIQADGEQVNIIIKASNTDEVERNRTIRGQENAVHRKKNKIFYTKKFIQTDVRSKMRNSLFTRDSNQFSFKTELNKDTSFGAYFYDITTESGEYERYNSRYLFNLKYKEFFVEHGTMSLHQRTNRSINQNSAILGNRVGFVRANTYLDFVEGRGFVGSGDLGDRIYGGSYLFNIKNNAFGLYYHQNEDGTAKTPTIDWVIPFLRNWEISGAATQNIAPGLQSNNSNVTLQYRNTVDGFGINSFYLNHYYRPEGQVDLVFGNLTQQQFERLTTGANLQLFKNKGEDSLNMNFGYGRTIGEYSLQNMYTTGLYYKFRKIDAGINYNLRSQFDTFDNESRQYYSYNPYITWTHQHENRRSSRVFVSSRLASGSDTSSNSYKISYQNFSQLNSHSLYFSRNTVDSENYILPEAPNANSYGSGYTYTHRILDNLRVNVGTNANLSNTQQREREEYYLDNYSYFAGGVLDINRVHNFSLKYTKQVNLRSPVSDVVSNSIFLGYSLKIGTDSLNPLHYLVNNKSIKAHFYYDTNFNGKFDKGEQLLTDMSVDLFDEKNALISKKTDKDGYVRFSGLERAQYKVTIPSSVGSVIANDHKVMDLGRDGSFAGEIAVVKVRNVSVKVFDETTDTFVKSSMSFDLSCPNIGYQSTQTFNYGHSAVFTIPDGTDCEITPVPFNYVHYFVPVDMKTRKIDSSDVIFRIKHQRTLDILSSSDAGSLPFEIRIDGKTHKVAASGIVSIPVKQTKYNINDAIVQRPGIICVPQSSSVAFHPDFFEKKQLSISCKRK